MRVQRQLLPRINRRVLPARTAAGPVEPDRPAAGLRGCHRSGAPGIVDQPAKIDLGAAAGNAGVHIDDLRPDFRQPDPEPVEIDLFEGRFDVGGGHLCRGQRHLQKMCLSGKLHVQRMGNLDPLDTHRLLPDQRLTLCRLRRQHLAEPVDIHRIQRAVHGTHKIMAQVGDNAAKRVRDPRACRHQHLGNPQLTGQRRGMKRSRTTKGEQAEIPRIETKRDRHHARRTSHAGCRHAQHGGRRCFCIHAKRIAKTRLENGADILNPDCARHRFQLSDIKPAKHHVGI